MNRANLPADKNEVLFGFLSKSDKEDDRELSKEGALRSPLDLRPPTLKNSDNKIVAGFLNWISKPVMENAA